MPGSHRAVPQEIALTGQQLAAVTDVVVGIWARCHGHGPESGKSFVNDRVLLTLLRGGMTPQERTLIERGRQDLVRLMRTEFEEVMRADYSSAIGDITGYEVTDYQSQILTRSELTVELFVLGEYSGSTA